MNSNGTNTGARLARLIPTMQPMVVAADTNSGTNIDSTASLLSYIQLWAPGDVDDYGRSAREPCESGDEPPPKGNTHSV